MLYVIIRLLLFFALIWVLTKEESPMVPYAVLSVLLVMIVYLWEYAQ